MKKIEVIEIDSSRSWPEFFGAFGFLILATYGAITIVATAVRHNHHLFSNLF